MAVVIARTTDMVNVKEDRHLKLFIHPASCCCYFGSDCSYSAYYSNIMRYNVLVT